MTVVQDPPKPSDSIFPAREARPPTGEKKISRDERFRSLVSGKTKGLGSSLLRGALRALSAVYGAAIRLRNTLYRRRIFRSHRLSVPVISVGNLTTGGTGKTPFVVWAVQKLSRGGFRPAILTRGYHPDASASMGAMERGSSADEVALFRHRLDGVDVQVGADRVAAGRAAIEKGATALVLDDGFQHRRLHRDLDIVLVDGMVPFGYDHILPRGLLREAVRGIARAGAIVLTRSDQVEASRLLEIESRLERLARGVPIARAIHRPTRIRTLRGDTLELSSLSGRRVFLVAGIGNPQSFRQTVEGLGARVQGCLFFPDHHVFRVEDTSLIRYHVVNTGAELVLTTEKDIRRGEELVWAGVETAYLEVEMEVVTGEEKLLSVLMAALATPGGAGVSASSQD
jgi:tetraacyldisaccharide 4'-kinase